MHIWTHDLQLADIPPPKSATLGLHPVSYYLSYYLLRNGERCDDKVQNVIRICQDSFIK